MRATGRQEMSSPITKANPTATSGDRRGLCRLPFVGHQPLLQHAAFKLRQLLGRLTLALVRPPRARRSYRGPSGPRLLPCYGRGVSRGGVNFCLYCNKTFRDAPSLDRHIREAYADVFRCPLCTKSMLRGSAQRHMKKKHSDVCDPAKGMLDNTIMMLQHKRRTSSL